MNDIKLIGCGGLARSGKDTFVAIAHQILLGNGYFPTRIAFADALKIEIMHMLNANEFGASVTTTDSAEKSLIRPLLVWWGCQRRRESEGGRYWIDILEKSIKYNIKYYNMKNITPDKLVFLISDVRFPNEAAWIHNVYGGEVVHLKKYSVKEVSDRVSSEKSFVKVYDDPPNEEERTNDPLVMELSNHNIEWETSSSSDVINDPTLNTIVLNTLNNTRYFKHHTTGILS